MRWEITEGGARALTLIWRESGGPSVAAPARRGFGTALIEQSLAPHNGRADINFHEDGLVCIITLPLPQQKPDIAVGSAGVEATPHAGAQLRRFAHKRVLIIEDEALIAMVLEDYLEQAGCITIGPAHTEDRALALIEQGGIDAALLDANLSGRRVDDVALALTQKRIPFAFVTGYGREALPRAFQEALAVDKPFTQAQIENVLEALLRADSKIVPLKMKTAAGE